MKSNVITTWEKKRATPNAALGTFPKLPTVRNLEMKNEFQIGITKWKIGGK